MLIGHEKFCISRHYHFLGFCSVSFHYIIGSQTASSQDLFIL